MKTSLLLEKVNLTALGLMVSLLLSIQISNAQKQNQSESSLDYLFPQKNKTMIMVGTGIPYIGIAEYSYGFSDRFSVGILVGTTPIVPGYGIRVKSILYQKDEGFRVFFKAPILYYPQTKDLGGEPWMLSWPSINAEWKFDSGIRLSAGIGLVGAARVDDLMGLNHPGDNASIAYRDIQEEQPKAKPASLVKEDTGFMGDAWNTIQTGLAIPLSKKMMFQSEVALVLDGISIADKAWIGKVPFILHLGLSYSF